jgi:hypothetical protein
MNVENLENKNFDINLANKIEAEKKRIYEEQMKSREEEVEDDEEIEEDYKEERIYTEELK